MNIPLVDLAKSYQAIASEIEPKMLEIASKGHFIGGPEVEGFEQEFSEYCHTRGCVGVANGTDALLLTLLALGIGDGDEVIVPALTFAATAEAVVQVGAKPVFVDVSEETFTIDPESVSRAISVKTKAIIPVHLYGQPADMGKIGQIAKEHQLKVIEDAAQAHGAIFNDERGGGLGDLGIFSFYPGKNLGAFGDAGAVTGNDETMLNKVRMLKNHGRREKYSHEIIGYNSRLDAIQAAVLRIKLNFLDKANSARQKAAKLYAERLKEVSDWLLLPQIGPDRTHVWHLYVVRCEGRDDLSEYLKSCNISTGIHYPKALHENPAFQPYMRISGSLDNAEEAARSILSLPMYPELNVDQIDYITDKIKAFGKLDYRAGDS